MKKLLTTMAVLTTVVTPAAVLTVLATPAFAHGTGMRTGFYPMPPQTSRPEEAFAQFRLGTRRSHSTQPGYDVYDTRGHYVGSDPDPLVRAQLQRDPPGRGD
jgi:hypothetical protein